MTMNEPNLSNINTKKVVHGNLVVSGVCSHCAHCGQPLTDSVSIERGIGPICSKKGYHEDPVDGDEIQALIELSDYPDLVAFLTEHYKPQGVRGLMNGLVKVCSLNRRSPVHRVCCTAIESLGYKRLASTLRKSLASVFITNSEEYPGHLEVRVLYRDYSRAWQRDLTAKGYGIFFSSKTKTLLVPVHKPDDESQVAVNGDGIPNRKILWDSLTQHYEGLVVRLPDENVEIRAETKKAA